MTLTRVSPMHFKSFDLHVQCSNVQITILPSLPLKSTGWVNAKCTAFAKILLPEYHGNDIENCLVSQPIYSIITLIHHFFPWIRGIFCREPAKASENNNQISLAFLPNNDDTNHEFAYTFPLESMELESP